MSRETLLLVEDDADTLATLEYQLIKSNYICLKARDGIEALELLSGSKVDLVLADLKMRGMDGLTLLREVKHRDQNIPFIILTGHGDIETAVSAIKQGAYDFLQKPYEPEQLLTAIRRSLEMQQLSAENEKLKNQLRGQYSFQNIITNSTAMVEALQLAEKVARTPFTTVAIFGESGTGKEVLARAIHAGGDRIGHNFVAVNCAGIPSNLLESELFGHVKGAFTGADKNHDGKFDVAQKGTILLDEIGDMPIDLQTKILRVLQERTYEKVGSNKSVKADFRVIVATHRDLRELVSQEKFREDLYHRVNAFPIKLPPLRERKDDIPLLANYFLEQFRNEFGKKLPGISQKAMDILINYTWTGNIRELKNCIERAAILTEDSLIQPQHLNITLQDNDRYQPRPGEDQTLFRYELLMRPEDMSLKNISSKILQMTLERCGYNKSKAADLLKVDRSMFYRRD